MKKSLFMLVLGVFLSGCSGNGVLDRALDVQTQPADYLTKTGMIRTTYENTGQTQYLMRQSQQSSTVPEKEKLVAGPVKECLSQTGLVANKCFEKYFREKGESLGPQAAFADLKVLYDVSAQVRSYCHPLAHEIGHAAVVMYPDVDEAYQHGDDFCWSGYYHGVMEEIMEKIGEEHLGAKLNDICANITGKENYSFNYYNCVHGMGHGLMDIMGDKLIDSLKMCDNLTGWWEQQSCYSGVFMQNVINDGLEYHKADLKPENTVYPCNIVDKRYKDQCYLMQTSYMLKINHYDFKKTFEICSKVDQGFEITCYRSLGRDASGSTVSDLKRTHDICLLGGDYTQQSECLVGAVKDFISYYHDDAKAKQLCKSFDGEKTQQYCLETVKDYYKTF